MAHITNDNLNKLQVTLNSGNILSDEEVVLVKRLVHKHNVHQHAFKKVFEDAATLRRKWRKVPINGDEVGQHLTFIRKLAYNLIKKQVVMEVQEIREIVFFVVVAMFVILYMIIFENLDKDNKDHD